jgi:hypothetical protein
LEVLGITNVKRRQLMVVVMIVDLSHNWAVRKVGDNWVELRVD